MMDTGKVEIQLQGLQRLRHVFQVGGTSSGGLRLNGFVPLGTFSRSVSVASVLGVIFYCWCLHDNASDIFPDVLTRNRLVFFVPTTTLEIWSDPVLFNLGNQQRRGKKELHRKCPIVFLS